MQPFWVDSRQSNIKHRIKDLKFHKARHDRA